MELFKQKTEEKKSNKTNMDLGRIIGIGHSNYPNFDNMYCQYTSEQLEELIVSLKETIPFLEYQKSLSVAFHKGQFQEVQRLLEKKIEGNLAYLRKDKGWKLRIVK